MQPDALPAAWVESANCSCRRSDSHCLEALSETLSSEGIHLTAKRQSVARARAAKRRHVRSIAKELDLPFEQSSTTLRLSLRCRCFRLNSSLLRSLCLNAATTPRPSKTVMGSGKTFELQTRHASLLVRVCLHPLQENSHPKQKDLASHFSPA